ncbi:MAG TPA: MBL fold metallo-hydrolase [Solirubrobacteraceae bacterium]|nr:MBL fold metallo-hydrolase [Solirubrobacteraceae bacterium]
MQVVSVHADVIVARSAVWQTTCTIVHRAGGPGAEGPGECFVIDSPVLPDEHDVLPALVERAGWSASGLLCTHGDWDHLLGRLAFPDAALGCAETTAARLRAEPGGAQRALREFDDEHYVERQRPLSLGQLQPLALPTHLGIGDAELDLLPADGHTEDGMAIWAPWARVLVCGDYLSPVEIPMLGERGGRDAYLATLERLRPYVEQADFVVPGHGTPLEGSRALAILREDIAYLEALPDPGARLPLARQTAAQRTIHAENLRRMGAPE